MNAKIHASVAVGERRSSSSVAQATSTQRKYDPMKISNHGTCMRAGYLASLAERIARHWDAEIVAELVAYIRSEEHTSELQSQSNLVCRLLLETKKQRE